MATPARVTNSLKRLCDFERGTEPLASALTISEKHFEIARLRSTIPTFILGHHDRMIQRGKRSIVSVVGGICSACHLRLPIGHLARLQSSQDLEVCDNCGTFIYLADEPACDSASSDKTRKRARGKRKAAQGVPN